MACYNSTQYIDGGTLDMDKLIDKIFLEDPKPPKSIMISFDNITMKEVYEALLMFIITGMKKLYGDENGQVKIGELDIGDIKKLKRYMNSIGFDLIFSEYTDEEWNTNIYPYFVQFNNMPYDSSVTDIKLYQYEINDTINNKHYTLSQSQTQK